MTPWQVGDPLFVVAWKDVLLKDEDDHALIQGSLVGPSHQACAILLHVQSGLVVCLIQESLGAERHFWKLTCQRENLRN